MTLDLQKKYQCVLSGKTARKVLKRGDQKHEFPKDHLSSLRPSELPPPLSHSSMILGKTGVYYHVFYLTDSQQVTDALLVPPLVLFLVNNPLVHKFALSSLKHVFSAAAPLAKKLEESVKKRIASIEAVRQGWNTTRPRFYAS